MIPHDRHAATGAQWEEPSRGPMSIGHMIASAIRVKRAIDEELQSKKHRRTYAKLKISMRQNMRNYASCLMRYYY